MCCIKTSCFGKRTTFILMMVLTTSYFFVEIIVGYVTNSMALVADSFHMMSDILSLFIGYFALSASKKKSGKDNNTFGLVRAEVLGALVNAVFLIALCFSITVEALQRLIETDSIRNPDLVLIVGGTGLFINVIGLFMFQGHAGHGHSHGGHGHSHGGHGHSHDKHSHGSKKEKHSQKEIEKENQIAINRKEKGLIFENKAYRRDSEDFNYVVTNNKEFTTIPLNDDYKKDEEHRVEKAENPTKKQKKIKDGAQMNMKGVYLHILGDALGSVIVMIAATIVKLFDGKWTDYVDPGMSILIVIIILKTTIPLLKESSRILLQYVPDHIQLKQLEKKMLVKFPEINSVHEFHVWQLTGTKIIASLHLLLSSDVNYKSFSRDIKEFFHHEGIHSTTIQPEFQDMIGVDEKCLISCTSTTCEEKVCCESPKKNKKGDKGKNDGEEKIKDLSNHLAIIQEENEETHGFTSASDIVLNKKSTNLDTPVIAVNGHHEIKIHDIDHIKVEDVKETREKAVEQDRTEKQDTCNTLL